MQFINPKEVGAWVANALDLVQSHLSWPIIVVMFLMGCVGLAVAYFLFQKYGSKIKIMEGLGTMDNPNDEPDDVKLLFFSTDWCPHCKVAQPEWDNLVSAQEGQPINGKNVIFIHHNCTEETPEVKAIIAQYKIEGYPTVKLIKDGQIIDFDAKPTEASLLQFLQASV